MAELDYEFRMAMTLIQDQRHGEAWKVSSRIGYRGNVHYRF